MERRGGYENDYISSDIPTKDLSRDVDCLRIAEYEGLRNSQLCIL